AYEWWHAWTEHRTLERNRAAVALVIAYKDTKALGQGSGVFINTKGLFLTNYHVIKGATRIRAKLPTGAYFEAEATKVAGVDRRADIAILQFEATETPAASALGDSDRAEAGAKVLAIGSPLGLENSVSEGMISNPRRSLQG